MAWMFRRRNLRPQGSHDDDADAQLIVDRREGQFLGGSWERIVYTHCGRVGQLEMRKQSLDDYHVNGVMISHFYCVDGSMFPASVTINRNISRGSLESQLCFQPQHTISVAHTSYKMPGTLVGGFINVEELSYGVNEAEAYFRVEADVRDMGVIDVSVRHGYMYQGAFFHVKLKIEKHPRKGIAARVTECTSLSNCTGHQLRPNIAIELPVVATTPQAQPGSYNNSGEHVDSSGITWGNSNGSIITNNIIINNPWMSEN